MDLSSRSNLVKTSLPTKKPFVSRRSPVTTNALFSKKKKTLTKREQELLDEANNPKRKQSFITGITNALDFSEARSKRDAELLYQARYQKGKLNEEQIGAMKRKINGTARDFWKDWVDVKGEYTDKGYVDKPEGVTGLPFLIAVVLGVFGALAYVVSQTAVPVTGPPT